MSGLFLGALETSGNQAYIFATNRLQENVGASQRVWQAGFEFPYRAAYAVTRECQFDILRNSANQGPEVHIQAMQDSRAPRLSNGAEIEMVVVTSGKTLFLANERAKAEDLIAKATLMVLDKAPGLSLRGAVVPICGEDAAAANQAIVHVHRKLDQIRDELPTPDIRFPTLPMLEPCPTSGLPAAAEYQRPEGGKEAASEVTHAKRIARDGAAERIGTLVDRKQYALAGSIDDLGADWVGIVHADGNGMGQLFLEFGKVCDEKTRDGYFDKLRRFSLSLDLCGVAAFRETLDSCYPDKTGKTPVIPLILGGDDLTLLCDGRIATDFAASYLKNFQHQTTQNKVLEQDSVIPAILKAKGWPKLGAAAGIAITKPHYPFHRGYELAENLLSRAKIAKTKVGTERCSLDFHVLFDSADTSLDLLRDRWTLPGKQTLTARPYVLKEDGDDKKEWACHRRWENLLKARDALMQGSDEDDSSGLPRSQQYALRSALFLGVSAADRRLALIKHRYPKFDWQTIAPNSTSPSLFFPTGAGNRSCLLIDALELADLAQLRRQP